MITKKQAERLVKIAAEYARAERIAESAQRNYAKRTNRGDIAGENLDDMAMSIEARADAALRKELLALVNDNLALTTKN